MYFFIETNKNCGRCDSDRVRQCKKKNCAQMFNGQITLMAFKDVGIIKEKKK